MNKNKTKKKIQQVIKNWTETIFDTELRENVRRDLVVSGGCIASMLLDQPVEDYDVYFRNVHTAARLAEFYLNVAGFAPGKSLVTFSKDRLDSTERAGSVNITEEPLKFKLEYVEEGGVNITGAPFTALNKDTSDLGGYEPIYFSKNAITLNLGIQLVIKFCGSIDTIHKTFDFDHTKNYYADEELVLSQESLEAILARELRYVGTGYPVHALLRTRKFEKRGWKISNSEIFKILYDISKLDLTDPAVFSEQIGGLYGNMIAEHLSKRKHVSREDFFELLDEYYSGSSEAVGNYL